MKLVSQVEINSLLSSLYNKKLFSRRVIATEALISIVRSSIENPAMSLQFFYLWGIHKKGEIDNLDLAATTHLSHVVDHVSKHLTCRVTLDVVLCDTHAELNGVSGEIADRYCRQITDHITSNYAWNIKKMSHIWNRHGITLALVRDNTERLSFSEWDELSCKDLLITSAAKYYSGGEPQIGARTYYIARMLEKKAINEEYKNCIHITAADKRLSALQPQLPELNIWSIKRGSSVKPWFASSREGKACVE